MSTLKPNGSQKDKSAKPRAVVEESKREQEAKRLINEGARLLARRKAKEAAEILEKAFYLAPDSVEVKINLGGAYILMGRFQDAIPLLQEAARQAPENPMVWTNLAAAYLGHLEHSSEEQQDAAIAAFKKALEVDPKAPHVDYNLGLIYLKRGDLVSALAHFRRALEVNPEDKDAAHYVKVIQAKLSAEPPPSREEDHDNG